MRHYECMDRFNLKEHDLFERYVAICNVALAKNADRFPFKQILKAAEEHSGGRYAAVEIVDNYMPAVYVLSIQGGRIVLEHLSECAALNTNIWTIRPCDKKWRITSKYLNEVVENASRYIDNPALLNWDWLYGARGNRGQEAVQSDHSATFLLKSLHGNSEEHAAQE